MVLFNLEIIEGLFQRGLTDKVTFITDSEIKDKFARSFYKVQTLLCKSWKNLDKTMEDIMAKMNVAPDITFTNPPYNGSMDLKILLALHEKGLLKKLICVHPSTWLVDNKGTKLLFKKFRDTFDKHTSSLEIFNGNPVFDIGLFVPCVISTIDMNVEYSKKKVSWFGKDNWTVSSFEDVTMYGSAWDPLVKDFQDKVSRYCENNGSILSHLIHCSNADPKKYHIQLAAIRGHQTNIIENMYHDDFYTFVQKTLENNKGIRNKADKQKTILQVDTQKEQSSLLFYLQSDFARLCLSLLKISQNAMRGETKLVPWMDFTKSWTDDDLFSELGYHKGHAIREYAKKFLPDYHNIYPNGKKY